MYARRDTPADLGQSDVSRSVRGKSVGEAREDSLTCHNHGLQQEEWTAQETGTRSQGARLGRMT